MKKVYYACLLSLMAFSCVSSQKLTDDKSIDKIYFGKTGGFTNIPVQYVFFESGQIFKIQQDSLSKVRKLGPKQVRNIESLKKEIDFKQIELNEPGNITYYIKVVTTEFEKELKWSDATENTQVKTLYNALVSNLK